MTEKLLNVDEVAELLGVKPRTVYAYVSQRAIPHIKRGRKVLRFSPSEIEKWILAGSVSVSDAAAELAGDIA